MRRYERDMSRLLGWIYNVKDISASDESKYFSVTYWLKQLKHAIAWKKEIIFKKLSGERKCRIV